jgi:hypothetical protein
MSTPLLIRTLVGMLALEWELCSQDPFVFCYRIGVSLREPSSEDSSSDGDSVPGAGVTCMP